MYLPRTLPLCEPHVATWIGASGRRYDFAVSRPATTWIDEAAVFLLVKCEAGHTDVLHIGHTCSLQRRFGLARERCPEIWRRALMSGMTHVHLRFEACSERARQAEVDDLVAALHPSLVQSVVEEAPVIQALSLPTEIAGDASGDVLVPYRARLKPTRARDPHIDIEAFDLDMARNDLPFGHAYEAPRSLRADPARECEGVFDDFEAVLFEPEVPSEPPASIVVLSTQPAVIEEAAPQRDEDEAARLAVPLAEERHEAVEGVFAALVREEPAPPASASEGETAVISDEGGGLLPADAVEPAKAGPPEPRADKEEQARGLFGRWLHALAERGGRWLGASSRSRPTAASAVAATAAAGTGLVADGRSKPIEIPLETGAAVAETAEGPDTSVPEAVRVEATLPEAVVAEADRVAKIPEMAGTPAEAPVVAAAVPAKATASGLPIVVETIADSLVAEASATQGTVVVLIEDDIVAPLPAATPDAIAIIEGEEPAAERPVAQPALHEEGIAAPAAAVDSHRDVIEAAKRACAFDPAKPLVLFADDISYESGADILADAIVTVCGGDGSVQFAFAGEGGLRGELQQRFWGAGLGDRCQCLGDVPAERFERLLVATDFLVIPARVRRGEELASLAVSLGKWVLATHQSEIACIVHGQNGLITYDNPGSLVWGIRELLGRVYHEQRGARAEAA